VYLAADTSSELFQVNNVNGINIIYIEMVHMFSWYLPRGIDALWLAGPKIMAAYHQGDDLKSHLWGDCL